MKDLKELINQCEDWLRNGHADKVGAALNQLVVINIPRNRRVDLANLARRASLIPLGLKILNPIFTDFDSGVPNSQPQPEEWAEMGVLLHKSGSTLEALKALGNARKGNIPEALLYTAFCHFSRWETEKAVEPLQEYTALSGLPDYQRAVGKVNLTAAYTTLKLGDEARRHLDSTLKLTMEKNFHRLTANLLDIGAQLDILEKKYDQAKSKLKDAENILLQDGSVDRLYVEKLLALIHLIENGDAAPLSTVRSTAVKLQHWETIRSCDLYLLKHQGTQQIFERLYFGSPFESLKQELRLDYAGVYEVPAVHQMGQGPHMLDLSTGELDGKPMFKAKRKVHDLCAVLFSDFYRPFRVGALFAGLFPGEHYNILYGPDRVYHLMHRLRDVIKKFNAGIPIDERNGFFRARSGETCAVLIRETAGVDASKLAPVLRLQKSFSTNSFSSKDARDALDMPHATLARLLKQAVNDGLIVKEGAGVYTRYKIAA